MGLGIPHFHECGSIFPKIGASSDQPAPKGPGTDVLSVTQGNTFLEAQ